jgi:hypothetical protein
MRALVQLAPLAVGLIVFTVVVTFLLQRQMAVGVWLLAAFLVGHGFIHVMFVAPPPASPNTPGAEFAFNVDRSWLVTTGAFSPQLVRSLVVLLVGATVTGYLLAGAATAGLLVPQAWWPALVIGATAASAALMLVGLSPGLALGIVIDVALVWLVVSRAWSPLATT